MRRRVFRFVIIVITPPALSAEVPPLSTCLFTAYDSSASVLGSCSVVNPTPVVLAGAGTRTQWNMLATSVVGSFLAPGGSLAASQNSVPISWSVNPLAFPIDVVEVYTSAMSVNIFSLVGGRPRRAQLQSTPGAGRIRQCP
ncbi:hypothetical protein [Chromobacterium sphagni]|uniref:hypothetical protein n=1 Tax=Chromobacterium sphagni TaxID=1903179 RepID=UPI0011134437|nr:hypothetical protein [Chromobacterium sphagni]